MLVCGEYGHGRTTAFTSDLAPHWAPPEFLHWPHYPHLWNAILTWTANPGKDPS
ncbi:glutamine amidotransferase [Gordonia sp. Z-3]|uniref:glutamine amidotransferase n=1 Tax=Gordonia sp. Z-3 TaxID=3115408 RepID=UPI002E2B49F3|nr:glutamine amidotransferase [Gordonia sp. Z-3]MED5803828.1 glutamine amidotransferase [Gordonia sp. Z-3]